MSLFKKHINQIDTCDIIKIAERYHVAKFFNSKAFAEFKGIYTGGGWKLLLLLQDLL